MTDRCARGDGCGSSFLEQEASDAVLRCGEGATFMTSLNAQGSGCVLCFAPPPARARAHIRERVYVCDIAELICKPMIHNTLKVKPP